MPKGKYIRLEPEMFACNPPNASKLGVTELHEIHQKRLAKDPSFKEGETVRSYIFHDEVSFDDELEALWGNKWGAQGIGKLREVLLSPPTENETHDEFYKTDTAQAAYCEQWAMGKPDLAKWREQYEGMVDAYSQNGVTVHQFETPYPSFGPYGYTRWFWAVTDAAEVINGGAIIPRAGIFGAQKGREPVFMRALVELGVPIVYMVRGKGVAELGGCVWLDDHHFIVEDGTIMNRTGIDQLKPVFALSGAKLVVAHSTGWYNDMHFPMGGTSHPDMFVAIPDIGVAVVSPMHVSYSFIKFLKRIKFDIIEVPAEEYLTATYNGVTIAPGKFLCPDAGKTIIKELERRKIDVIAIPYTECPKAGGAIHCSSCELVREPGPLVEELTKTPLEVLAPECT
jgi:N-dimethylarginine dimethylaminohydrolase